MSAHCIAFFQNVILVYYFEHKRLLMSTPKINFKNDYRKNCHHHYHDHSRPYYRHRHNNEDHHNHDYHYHCNSGVDVLMHVLRNVALK